MSAPLNNVSLKPYNTFGIDVSAKEFIEINAPNELIELIHNQKINKNRLILGGGSNILLTRDFNGQVIKNNIKGKQLLQDDGEYYIVKAGAGENWHNFVIWCLSQEYNGLENLSLIPGNVGASPMQNIGAYGVEIKDVFLNLEAIELASGETKVFYNEDCSFGYRESVFKNIYKDQYFITSVTFKLPKKYMLNTSYGAIEDELKSMGISSPNAKDVSNAVIQIRQRKLPDPREIGNSGSFFKNPVVSNNLFEKIKAEHPKISSYDLNNGTTKIAAGWLIEHAGWKGKTYRNYGVHKNQSLVLVNYGGASGKEIYNLSEQIIKDIQEKFGITLEREVNIL